MKVLARILLAIVLALAWQLNAEIEVHRQQRSQITELGLVLLQRHDHESTISRCSFNLLAAT
jgi:hypothetical protein